jgi:exopolyphosphatase/guanosine-5'-triphosphate,3'-diphosphate pyrophosphatase
MHIGCVSFSHRWFDDGRIDEENMSSAVTAARVELRPVKGAFATGNWGQAVGSSGTIKSIRDVVVAAGWCEEGISRSALKRLREALIEAGSVAAIDLSGVSDERKPVFAGGVAVLSGVFKSLDIEHMQVSDTALREGLLYEMLGQINHTEDVRERTVETLVGRYGVDPQQAQRVEMTASALLAQVARSWQLVGQEYSAMLGWACRLHEIGITVSHSGFHKHGAYLVANSDLPGFSRRQQQVLAALIRAHRRKFPLDAINELPDSIRLCVSQLAVLLRLAVLLHRGRSHTSKPMVLVEADGDAINLNFPDNWLDHHPLTQAELAEEAKRLGAAGFRLEYH